MKKLLFLLAMFISISSFAQDVQLMINRVEKDGTKPDNSRYYLYEDKMIKFFKVNNWEDEVISIKEIWVEKPDNESYYWAQIKTKNSGGYFYIHYDPYWAAGEGALLAVEQSLFPPKFQQYIDDLIETRESQERLEEDNRIAKQEQLKREREAAEVARIEALMLKDGLEKLIDIDGNQYRVLKFGNQIWMIDNLKTTKYSDGSPIPNITKSHEWGSMTNGAYCWYNNNPANIKTWGALYNYFAVIDTRNVCPTGWHVPTEAEWLLILDVENQDFNFLKAGYRTGYINSQESGNFYKIGNYGMGSYWSTNLSKKYKDQGAVGIYDGGFGFSNAVKSSGASVRCIKDDMIYSKNLELKSQFYKLNSTIPNLESNYKSLTNKLNNEIEKDFCLNTSTGLFIGECFEKNSQNIVNAFQILYMDYLKSEKVNLDEKSEIFNMHPGVSIQAEDVNLLEEKIFSLEYENKINEKLELLEAEISFFEKGTVLLNEFELTIQKFKEVLSSDELKSINKSLKGITDIQEIKSLIGLH